jgi:hypothetical protein
MMPPLVSVIIPYRNMERTIRTCLASCLAQTHTRLELVLVNNNSTDLGPRIVRELSNVSHHPFVLTDCLQPGVCAARNHGLAVAKGDYIQWLDADDTLSPDKIATQVEALEKRSDYAIAYSDWRWKFRLDPHSPHRHLRYLRKTTRRIPPVSNLWQVHLGGTPWASVVMKESQEHDFLLRLLEDRWLPPHAYLLARVAADRLRDNDVFSSDITYADDRHYFTTAAILGMPFLYVPGTSVDYHTWSSTQLTIGTPAEQRLKNIRLIFDRLRRLASEQDEAALSLDHWFLLNQDHGLWRCADQATGVAREGSTGDDANRNPESRVQLTRREAQILRVIATNPGVQRLEVHAKTVAHQMPELWNRNTEILRTLVRFTELGLLQQADPDA